MIDVEPCVLTDAMLSSRCLAHLEREEALLTATREALRQVHAALVRHDLRALTVALERQGALAGTAESLRHERDRLRQDLAAALGVPVDAARVRALAERLPGPDGERLRRVRARLKGLAEEVEVLNHSNAFLVRACLDFQQRLLDCLTGSVGAGPCYDPTGQVRPAARGALLEAQG